MEDIADEKENQVILPYCFEKPMIPSRRPIVYRNLADLMTTDYMDDIKAHMYSRENQNDLLNCLQNHRIDEDQRSKMVDWMAEVLWIYNSSSQTYFLAVKYMDTFFKLVKRTVGLEELHVIGVACIYIASKYEDVKFINMESLYSKISYKKLPIKYIKKVEREILETLGYRLAIPTVLDFLYEKIKDQNDEFVKSAYLIADLSMLNYDLAMVKSSCLADAICIVTKQVIFKHEQLIFNNEILHVLYSLKSFITDFCKNSNGLISVLTRHSAQIASSPSNLFEFNW